MATRWLNRVEDAVRRHWSAASRGVRLVEAVAAVLTIGVAAAGVVRHFESDGVEPIPGEGKRIIAFRQVANRICSEHRANLRRALREARGRIQRLGFVSRAIGWDVNDLESITPPPSRSEPFLSEVEVRRRARPAVLSLQQAIELGDGDGKARAIAALEAIEVASREASRAAGLSRCVHVLPPISRLTAET